MKACAHCGDMISEDEGRLGTRGELVCFACEEELKREGEGITCPECGETFPADEAEDGCPVCGAEIAPGDAEKEEEE